MADGKNFSERLAGQLTLVTSFVLFVGTVTTEAYYAVFGIRYQFLQFPVSHIVYRGLTIITVAPLVAVPLLVALGWLALEDRRAERPGKRETLRQAFSYGMIIVLLASSYPLAWHAGVSAGRRDVREDTTTLPRLEALETDLKAVRSFPGDRVLWLDANDLIFFSPVPTAATAEPLIKRVGRNHVQAVEVGR